MEMDVICTWYFKRFLLFLYIMSYSFRLKGCQRRQLHFKHFNDIVNAKSREDCFMKFHVPPAILKGTRHSLLVRLITE